jgi:peptide/nickel transport system permease protein/oligopeptide transport system permease protein
MACRRQCPQPTHLLARACPAACSASIPSGSVTQGQVTAVAPFGNWFVTKKVNASTLIAALNKDRFLDNLVMGGALVGSTIPGFWLGLLLMLMFSVQLGWFPISGAKGVSSLVLPVLTIGIGGVALVARVTRVAMIEASGRDFVTLLHAKGMPPQRIHLRHVLRHAMIPVVTILSLRIGWILGGAVIVEVVFARPGLGSLLIKALGQHDYPVIQACLLMLAMAVMFGTLLGDLVQAAMDPRVRAALT